MNLPGAVSCGFPENQFDIVFSLRPHRTVAEAMRMCSKDKKLQSQLGQSVCLGFLDLRERPRHLFIGQSRMVFLQPLHRRQYFEKGSACRVVKTVAMGHRPVHDRFHPLSDPARSLGFLCPDGFQHGKGIGRGDRVNSLLPQLRESVGFEG